MSSIHFFNIQSRFGMKNIPFGGTELNLGVEHGGSAVLTPDFKLEFPLSKLNSYLLPNPEDLDEHEYLEQVVEQYKTISEHVSSTLQSTEVPVFLGGDHSISLVSYLTLTKLYKTNQIGWIQFDSHADLHLESTSQTQNIHGMWLRMCCDQFDNNKVNEMIQNKMDPQQIAYVGNLILEAEEERFIKEKNILRLAPNETNKLEQFIHRFKHMHISFDIDVFMKDIAPATGTPNEKGLLKDEVFAMLDVLKSATSISLDLVEVNPQKEGAEQTVELAREVLMRILE